MAPGSMTGCLHDWYQKNFACTAPTEKLENSIYFNLTYGLFLFLWHHISYPEASGNKCERTLYTLLD